MIIVPEAIFEPAIDKTINKIHNLRTSRNWHKFMLLLAPEQNVNSGK